MSVSVVAKFGGGPLDGERRVVLETEREVVVSDLNRFGAYPECVDGGLLVQDGIYEWVQGTVNPRVFVWKGWKGESKTGVA